MNQALLTQQIKTRAVELGFTACGVARAEGLDDEAARLDEWLRQGMNGKMTYMERWRSERIDPGKLVVGARSVICVLQNYFTPRQLTSATAVRISKNAYGTDYHRVVKQKLERLLGTIRHMAETVNGRVFVDTAPVLERAWAERAGLGWRGKNSLLIHPDAGSFFFLGELIVDIELEYDQSVGEFCASCRRCLDACPTGAIVEPRVVDARRCISYLTIEYRGSLPSEFAGRFNGYVFGCDICQDVCPFNRKAIPHREPQFEPSDELMNMTKEDWHKLGRGRFERLFRRSTVTRTRYGGLKRNIESVLAEGSPNRSGPDDPDTVARTSE